MIRKPYFLLSLLQAVLSQEWKADTPRDVRAQKGLCALIPCHYSYPSNLANKQRDGVWFNTEKVRPWAPLAFHSKDHRHESDRFRHRTGLSGDLKDGDCSLIINNITAEDAGPYFFRVEFDNGENFNYYPATQLHVSDFTDKPTIFAPEIIEGKSCKITCTFNTTCGGTAPDLTWDNPTDVPGSVSNSVTQHGGTLTYSSVLTLVPSPKHYGQTLTCRVSFPSVSSERTLALTVQYAPRNLSITSLDTIKDSSISITVGNSTALHCSVESFPASNLRWEHLGVTVNRSSSNNEVRLELPHVTSRVAGEYRCVAENEHGAVESSITITVEHAPRNLSITSLDTIKDSSINITEGNSTALHCSVESFPASNLRWEHRGVTVIRSSSNNEVRLELPHVTSRVAGEYRCVAENEHGAVESSITITVEHAPRNLSITSLDTIKDSSISLTEGNSTALHCSVESFPASNLRWEHRGVTVNRSSSNNEVRLDFPHVTSRVAGEYRCVAENEHGAVESSITITVEHAPRNLSITSLDTIKDSSISVTEGNSTALHCSVESFPASNLRWEHLGVTVIRSSSNNEVRLELPHVTSRVAGEYRCVAENEHGAVESSITVTVEHAPRNLSITSLDTIKDSSISITEGNSTALHCSVESFPASNLRWEHRGVTVIRSSSNNEVRLELPHVTSRVAGEYRCVAENEHGAVESSITVTVEHAPRNLSITSLDTIKDSSISITEGNSTALHCSVESFPASNLRWEHLGVTVIRSRSNNEVRLELPHVTSRVAGEYRCVAENEHGAVESSITITVEHAPRNLSITSLDTIKDSSISITEGNSTALHCSVESFPASNLRWEHRGVTVIRSSSNNEVRLELPHVTSRVAGEYRCVAENEHGAVESSITVTVEHAPSNLSITSLDTIKDSSISITEGNSTALHCSVESFPASNLRWEHLGVTVIRSSSNNEVRLELPHVTSRVAGEYRCVAENEHGAVESSITITVEHGPRNLSITSLDTIKDSSISVTEGNSTALHCSVESFPASNLRWEHRGVTVIRSSSNNEVRLELPHVTSRVAGEYRCVAENEHGAVESSITITVEHAPRNLSITSLDTIKDSSISITEGNSTAIHCSVESFPASNLRWEHLGVTVIRSSSNNEVRLELPHVTSRVAGEYRCVAENEHGAVESSITITVEHPPKGTAVIFSRAMHGIREGDNVTLTCSSESVPPASGYVWFRIDGNTRAQLNTSARSINLAHVTRENDADFYCTASNPLGSSTSPIVHLSVEYKPEISDVSECAWRDQGITCVCATRSNPPGNLTWHLPRGNFTGNQTHGHLATSRVSNGHLATGTLTMRGREDEKEVKAICSVRNKHGEARFQVSLWVKGRETHEWKGALLGAGITLCGTLAGFLIFKCVKKRKEATENRASEASDVEMTNSPFSGIHEEAQNTDVVNPWNTSSDETNEAEIPGAQNLPEGPAGGDAGQEQPRDQEDLLYANINFLKLPSGDGTVHKAEGTEYAQIKFQSK
ncbi:basement membrane-specific heparan sulfate proteoglycan core protein-like [Heptranchias perlo]|uniref:basement membrane-specific heparan sulfate proteoglycan core protein-like n=1 Tax=Heptranchias perlo TaxID=212740 RepID=UPI00355A8954